MSTVNNEKKQDLLLDALSCIDEDILERGLALRDGEAAAKNTAQPQNHLFDLSELNGKPPRKTPWRAILVAAAIIALLAVVPLSAWMVASRKDKWESAGDPANGIQTGSQIAVQTTPLPELDQPLDDIVTEEIPEKDPTEDESMMAPGAIGTEAAGEPEDVTPGTESPDDGPIEDITEAETNEHGDTVNGIIGGDMEWIINENYRDSFGYIGSNGVSFVILQGTVITERDQQSTISPEDQLALKLVGQWFYSVYTLHYEQHFPLFPDEALDIYILPQFAKAGKTYKEGVAKIIHTAEETAFFQSLSLSLSLIDNKELEGNNREEFLRQFALYHPDVIDTNEITSVRKIRFADGIEGSLDGRFLINAEDIPTEFYCYEYNSRWYLDTQGCLEDDLSIDLLEANPDSSPYYKARTVTGVVTGRDEEYLYMDGLAILIHGLKLPSDLMEGSIVTVTYHGVGVKLLLTEFNQPPTKTVTQYIGDSITVVTP